MARVFLRVFREYEESHRRNEGWDENKASILVISLLEQMRPPAPESSSNLLSRYFPKLPNPIARATSIHCGHIPFGPLEAIEWFGRREGLRRRRRVALPARRSRALGRYLRTRRGTQ